MERQYLVRLLEPYLWDEGGNGRIYVRDGSSHLPLRTWWDDDCKSPLCDFMTEWMVEETDHNGQMIAGLG